VYFEPTIAHNFLERRMKLEVALWTLVFILVVLAFLFPKTRPFSLSLITIAIVAIVSIVVIAQRVEPPLPETPAPPVDPVKRQDFEQFRLEKLDKADPEAKTRIPVQAIRFDQVRAEAGAERGTVGTIAARLYNDSATYTLTDYGYYLVIQDCIKAVCTTVFDQHGLASISVPPRQARDVTIELQTGGPRNASAFKILGTLNILLTPTETRAGAFNTAQSVD
jgi:hypothetical protein